MIGEQMILQAAEVSHDSQELALAILMGVLGAVALVAWVAAILG